MISIWTALLDPLCTIYALYAGPPFAKRIRIRESIWYQSLILDLGVKKDSSKDET
jgi:hypothetical protein